MSAGAKDWFRQRASAVLLIPLSAWFLWAGVSLAGADYATTKAFFGQPLNAAAAVLLAVIGLFHTQRGADAIISDYVPGEGFQKLLVLVSKVGCTIGALVVIWAVVQSF
ncbi:MAG: succinate dehydrogenase, hydrophobic membrane anchor protein [Xanthomonadales bacterium]|jgi:succinate dehydrogenase / fumarate reductase membrane anchor subunit|nr:succinate dehydrogenase, hydrophobic membrane anchor protein [Xanthomonadales bacterium]